MKRIFVVVVTILLFADNAYGQSVEDELLKLLQRGHYKDLVNKVCLLREKEYFKNAFMDYCLAYGYCKLNKRALSGEWFDHILASYSSLSTEKRRELRQLKERCTNTHTAGRGASDLLEFLRTMNAESFRGQPTGIESKMGTPSITDTVKELDFEHLTFDTQKRKFTVRQKKEALSYYRNLIGNKRFKVDTTTHFLFFYPTDALAIGSQMKQLEDYYSFYTQLFNLGESERLIIVFYCTNRDDLNSVARQIHKIPVPTSTYGYASSIDLVMMGMADENWLGAMKHELFHLMIRSFIGDIPPWLDEGTACFFESSSLRGTTASTNFDESNYRVRILYRINEIRNEVRYDQKVNLLMPSLQKLTNYNWQEFSGKTGDLTIRASYNQSLSYAFVTYLRDKNLLRKTMEAFRNRSYAEPRSEGESEGIIILHVRTSDELLENVTGMNMHELQSDFAEWCRKKNIYLR